MSEKSHTFSSAVRYFGWYGAVALPIAFGLQVFDLLGANVLYYLINATGAIGLVVLSARRKMWAVGFMGGVWTFLSVIALLRLFVGDPAS